MPSLHVLDELMNQTIAENRFLELVLNAFETSVACVPCYVVLGHYLSFVNNSLSIERRIREHCEVKGIHDSGQIKLNTLSREEYYQMGNGCTDVEIKNECFMETKEQELNYSQQVIDQIDYDSSRYQDAKPFLDRKAKLEDTDSEFIEHTSEVTSYKHKQYDLQNCILSQEYNSETRSYNDAYRAYLYRALWKDDVPKVPLYKCEICPFQTERSSNLRAHGLTHKSISEVPLYKCEICPFQTKRRSNLRAHGLTHKSISEVPLYKCEICGKKVIRKKYLQKHMMVHKSAAEILLHKCKICALQTKYKANLRKHMLIHKTASEVPLHNCEMCSFQTRYKCSLKNHMLSHNNSS